MADNETVSECPVKHVELMAGVSSSALANFRMLDSIQDDIRPVLRSTEADGYWMFTDYATILDGLQHPELWSSSVITPTEPDPPFKWIPVMVDPPDHAKWRKVLADYFSPGRVKDMKKGQHRLVGGLIDKLKPEGGCEYVTQVARVFPSIVFLNIMGMPTDDLDQFLAWEDMILHQEGIGEEVNARRLEGMTHVMGYFQKLIEQRRAESNPDADDIVSAAINWKLDGEPINDMELLNCLLLLFMAGLDTVAGESSYAMLHMATHPDDRRRIATDPSVIPRAVEELLRAYSMVQTARKATQDMDFHGCPVKAGDMAAFPIAMANRDDQMFPDGRRVDLDRGVTRHIAFGAGPHRCLGSHLARQEMAILLEEWHKRIPEYELAVEPIEHGGQMFGLNALELRWNT
ncbi:cytochrome P450 [Mycobacterium deserti]|uniref:Cytochrome P450 n=1 Tax=Mycobacterium deserti TaxID=2978347 RepID=A0ABT2M4G8_9MYCO|nr:cytochrome P450 [Mycobacterium deserti]MCT7657157.1 cytochrome P450 [Mycobacterium deserti]